MVQSVKRDKKDRVLSIRDLNISFKTNYGVVNAIRGVRLDLFKGETIAIVGESGSGKSVTCKTIMGILDSNGIIDSGEITLFYKDENGNEKTADLTKMSQKQIRYEFCGRKISFCKNCILNREHRFNNDLSKNIWKNFFKDDIEILCT